jgi:dethiobiotin synthetase
MGKVIFITGTDTGVGKTVVSALLLYHFRLQGVKTFGVKPFCSGSRSDTRLLREVQAGELTMREITPFHFEHPLAPGVQAWGGTGPRPNLTRTLDFIGEMANRADLLLVEGCGGLRVPLGPNFMVLDVVESLKCPVLLVGANRLGGINQALLSLDALQAGKVVETRLILNEIFEGKSGLKRSNESFLKTMTEVKGLISLGFMKEFDGILEGVKKCHKKVKKDLARVVVGR